jgi:Fe-S-cluster containining protein
VSQKQWKKISKKFGVKKGEVFVNARNGSDLCRECGICCTGIFFLKVAVTQEEAQIVDRCGIEIFHEDEKLVFNLPCSAHVDKMCTIYTQRPGICRQFTCKLLDQYQNGTVLLETAQEQTEKLNKLYQKALSLSEDGDRRFVWKLIHTKLGDEDFRRYLGNQVTPELGAVISELRVLIDHSFRKYVR